VIANVTATPEKRGIGKAGGRQAAEKKAIVSHIGTNPETGRQMNPASWPSSLVPQGTLADEDPRRGAGLGGIHHPYRSGHGGRRGQADN
jgi:acetate CoA/acetoacetate CoA-transferase alpha subunit